MASRIFSHSLVSFFDAPPNSSRAWRTRASGPYIHIQMHADLAGDMTIGDALKQVYALPEANNLPATVRLQTTGDAEIMEEVFSGFAMAMGAGLVVGAMWLAGLPWDDRVLLPAYHCISMLYPILWRGATPV